MILLTDPTLRYRAKRLFGQKFDSLFCFAIVREPVEWLYSCFRHYQRHGFLIRGVKSENMPLSFDEFLDTVSCLEPQLRPSQSLMLIDSNGKLLANSVGIFSELDQYYHFLRDYLNLSSQDLPHHNKNVTHKDKKIPFDSKNYKNIALKYWSSDYVLYDLALKRRFSSNLKNTIIFPKAPSINLYKYDPWALFAKSQINSSLT